MRFAAPQTLVAFAALPGGTAYSTFSDESADRGSLYTRSLVFLLAQGRHPVEQVVSAAEREVERLTGERQQPMHEGKGLGYLYLAAHPRFDDETEEVWSETIQAYLASGQAEYLARFIGFYPASPRSPVARQRLAIYPPPAAAPLPTTVAEAPLATGNVQSVGRSVDGALLATVTNAVKLRSTWGTLLKSGVVRSLTVGESVLVRPWDVRAGAIRVETASGESGYVGGIDLLGAEDVRSTTMLRFAGAEPEAVETDPDALPRTLSGRNAKDFAVRITVGPSGHPSAERGRQVSFLRSLRLRRQAVTAGASPSRVTTQIDGANLPADTARIEVLRR
jgi:hypothetical protein